MEPNNIENQIKEKLNSREIAPSEMAWDRLDAMLSVTEEKKTKRSFGWLYIAASILVLVSAGMFFFNQKEIVVKSEDNVVNQNTNLKNENNSVISKQILKNEIIIKKEAQVAHNPQPTTHNPQQSSKSFNSINQKTKVNPISNPLKEVDNKEVIAQKETPKTELQKTDVITNTNNQNPNDAIASVQNSKPNDVKIKVSANSLLSQVDGELNQTFRDKVITKISKNYQGVKVALATRNQE